MTETNATNQAEKELVEGQTVKGAGTIHEKRHKHSRKHRSYRKERNFFIWILRGLILLLPLVAIYFMRQLGGNPFNVEKKSLHNIELVPTVADTTKKSLPLEDKSVLPKTVLKPQAKVQTQVDDTVRFKQGETLTILALKYYGSKDFWCYIYKHNQTRISKISNITKGTLLIIPHPSKYDINVKDKASLARARKLNSEILSKTQ